METKRVRSSLLRRQKSLHKKKKAVTSVNWEKLNENGDKMPCARTYFTLNEYGGRFWLFGGFGDVGRTRFDDIHCYDPAKDEWSCVEPRGPVKPRPVYLHSAVVYGDSLYVYGGSSGSTDTAAFYEFSFKELKWTRITQTEGPKPGARFGHSAVVMGDRMVLAGGSRQSSQYLNDCYAYHFPTKTWSTHADLPDTLAYHTLFVYDDRLHLFSGFDGKRYHSRVYNLTANGWRSYTTKGTGCTNLCGVALSVWQDSAYVFGGFRGNKGHTNDFYEFHIPSRTWYRRSAKGSHRPVARAYLQSGVMDGEFYIFGGYDGTKCLRDFLKVELPAELRVLPRLADRNTTAQQMAALLTKHFGGKGGGFDEEALVRLCAHLSENEMPDWAPVRSQQSAGRDRRAHLARRFDEKIVKQICDMGYPRDDVYRGMILVQRQGRQVNDPMHVVDVLLEKTPRELAVISLEDKEQLSQQLPSKADVRERKNNDVAHPSNFIDVPDLPTNSTEKEVRRLKEQLASSRQCKICYDNEIDHVLLPCGHITACGDCLKLLKRKRCPMCNSDYKQAQKVFW